MTDIYPISVNNAVGTQVPLVSATASGDSLQLAGIGRAFLMVHNSGAAPVNVTIEVPGMTWNGHPCPDTQVSVPVAGLVVVPVPADRYSDTNRQCSVTYSSAAGVRVAAVTS